MPRSQWAGTLMQGVTRNPLADAGILGINAGAAMSTVIAIGVFGIYAPEKLVLVRVSGCAPRHTVVVLAGTDRPAVA